MKYPIDLSPVTGETIVLPDGTSVQVVKAIRRFERWSSDPPGSSYGGKAIVSHKDEPVFAELKILRSFIDAGWEGVWIDTFGNRYLRNFWPIPVPVTIPVSKQQLLNRLCTSAAKPWDVFCWLGTDIIFVEAKRAHKDRIRKSQIAFLQNALASGLPLCSFLLVEWAVD